MLNPYKLGEGPGGAQPLPGKFFGLSILKNEKNIFLYFLRFFCYFHFMAYKITLTPEDREFFRLSGRKGGRKRNPLKGFGSGDNARKAALARWAKVKKAK